MLRWARILLIVTLKLLCNSGFPQYFAWKPLHQGPLNLLGTSQILNRAISARHAIGVETLNSESKNHAPLLVWGVPNHGASSETMLISDRVPVLQQDTAFDKHY